MTTPNRLQQIEIAMCQWLFRLPSKSSGNSFFGQSVGEPRRNLSRFTLFQLAESLKLDRQIDQANEAEMRLRLALHFCPSDAIEWNPTRSESRVDVIANHLKESFQIFEMDADSIARDIASILSSWETRRRSLASKADRILERQNFRCACCHVPITEERIAEEESKSSDERDHFKPYFDEPGVRTWLSAEVDHVVPVSAHGTNHQDNLQVLCKLCNSGKANDVGVTVFQELKYASKSIEQVLTQHRRRLLYFRVKMDSGTCSLCQSSEHELTVRKVRSRGGLLLSNLTTVCHNCIS